MFERTELPEGPRVITARLPGTRSLAVAAYVLAGSRLESRERSGTAHFMEHLTFKGTRGYPTTRAVSEAIEGIGGTCNAATDRESTVYWTRLPVREAERAFEVIADLIVRPLLRSEDIRRERDIIVEEIRSYRDDPGQYIYNVFDETFFGDSPLGWEIAGDIGHDAAVDLVARSFGRGNGPVPSYRPAPTLPARRFGIHQRPTSQAHLCLGLPGLPRDDPDQWTLELLNTVLGDGSSSRLFLRVREEAGLAYDVHSFQTDYADCGTLQVYAGVDPADLGRALEAILAELARLRDEPIPDAELAKARAFTAGRLELRLEESRHMASWLGVQEALHDRVLTVDEALAALEGVTPEAIQALCGRLIRDEALTLAVIAPARRGRALERALKLP